MLTHLDSVQKYQLYPISNESEAVTVSVHDRKDDCCRHLQNIQSDSLNLGRVVCRPLEKSNSRKACRSFPGQ